MPPFPTSFILLGQGWHFEWRFPGELGKGCADVKCNGSCEGWNLERWGERIFSAPKGPIEEHHWETLTAHWLWPRDKCLFFLLWQGAFEKILASWTAERGGAVPAISENIDGCFRLNVLFGRSEFAPCLYQSGPCLWLYFSLACDSELADLWFS